MLMELLPFYFIDEIEPLLGLTKESLIQHVSNGRISLAVMEHVLGMPLYSNLLHEKHSANHFKHCGDCRFIYIHHNVISLYKDLVFSESQILHKAIVSFEKSPIGHPDNGLFKDSFRFDFGNEYYEKWWHETQANERCAVYLTCDAIQYSPLRELFMSSVRKYTNKEAQQKIIPIKGYERKYLIPIINLMKKLNNSELDVNDYDLFEEFKKELVKKYGSVGSIPEAPTVSLWLDDPNSKPENRLEKPAKTLKIYIDKIR